MKFPYQTYRMLIRFGTRVVHIEVVAVDISAAKADVFQAYEGAEIIQWGAV